MISPAPKPEPSAPKKPSALPKESAKRIAARVARGERTPYSTIRQSSESTPQKPGKAIPKKNSARRERRRTANAKYYSSSEWREKRKMTFERDGYQCVEIVEADFRVAVDYMRCPNRGEVVNGKQTARGLVCEEFSYQHRGVPQRIDTCKTRCRDCDRRLTPLERINHAHGFRGRGSQGET